MNGIGKLLSEAMMEALGDERRCGPALQGGADDDILHGDGAQGDLIPTGEGNSFVTWTLDEFHGDDYLDGGDGNDKLYGYGGDDILLEGMGMKCRRWHDGLSTLSANQNAELGAGGSANDETWRRAA